MVESKPTKVQKKKLDYLFGKGGHVVMATYFVKMPDGTTANVDPFGRVGWLPITTERDKILDKI